VLEVIYTGPPVIVTPGFRVIELPLIILPELIGYDVCPDAGSTTGPELLILICP